MRPLWALLKKEFLESARTGRLMILSLLFVLFGIMNPAIAKLTPWMLEVLADSMAESGLIVTNVHVDAMSSWTQFFKNIPIALIVFVLIFSDSFTREYASGTLVLALTKGLSRYKVVLTKTAWLYSLWTLGYGICFAITYGYTAYYWDNRIANHIFSAAAMWWLFGVWVISLVILFSSLLRNNAGVTLCTGGAAALAYLLRLLPKVKTYSPALLLNVHPLLSGGEETGAYLGAVLAAAVSAVLCIAVSVLGMNKRQL